MSPPDKGSRTRLLDAKLRVIRTKGYTQAVLQGAFILAKLQGGAWSLRTVSTLSAVASGAARSPGTDVDHAGLRFQGRVVRSRRSDTLSSPVLVGCCVPCSTSRLSSSIEQHVRSTVRRVRRQGVQSRPCASRG